jgi:hypothetical protein
MPQGGLKAVKKQAKESVDKPRGGKPPPLHVFFSDSEFHTFFFVIRRHFSLEAGGIRNLGLTGELFENELLLNVLC